MSSFLLRFVEGIMRLNQHKHFNKSKYNEPAAPPFSTSEKIYLTFYDTNNYKNSKYNHVQHLFSMKHIFLEENTASLSIQKKEGRKNWIRTIILATQNSFNKSNVFNWLPYENIFFPFKYTLLLFSRFYFLGTNIKGTIFSGQVRSHPLHPPSLSATRLNTIIPDS